MNCERAIFGLIAVAFHAALLFGFRFGSLPVPSPISEEPIEVSLVTGAPAPPPPSAEAPAEAPPVPTPPAPVLEPIPEPEPTPEPTPIPEPATPLPHRDPPKPQRAAVPIPRKTAPKVPAIGAATGGVPAATIGAGGPRGDSTARPRFNPKPPYPPEARRSRQEGRVLLQVAVSAEGRATNVSVIRSSGVPALDEAAAATVRRWTFEPARVAGAAVGSRVEVPVVFGLSN